MKTCKKTLPISLSVLVNISLCVLPLPVLVNSNEVVDTMMCTGIPSTAGHRPHLKWQAWQNSEYQVHLWQLHTTLHSEHPTPSNVSQFLDDTRIFIYATQHGSIAHVGVLLACKCLWMLQTAYAASKAALNAVSKGLHCELRPFGIPVVLIAPGESKSEPSAKVQV